MLRGRYGWGWAVVAWLLLAFLIVLGALSATWLYDLMTPRSGPLT